MYTKEESRNNIRTLVEHFSVKLDFIKNSGQYKEAQIEDEFLKPLFRYLNWNISNEGIQNPADREFIVQAKGKNGKEPDYLLQIDKKPLFYIEAKHSKYYLGGQTEDKGKVRERTDYIWQAYSYAYSTQTKPKYEKVDFALLTDFEEFRFFDCTFRVKNHSTLNNYCVVDWTYKDYIQNFDTLWEYFERENVRNGSISKLYINEKKIKENRISPDKAFLQDLDDEKDGWRIKFAKDIKKYHPDLTAEFITQAVQLILDRFIFIKVLSDREIEEDYIQKIVNKISSTSQKEDGILYDECKDIFDQLDKTYNGSIFTRRSELDSVKVSNKILLEVLKDLLPENSRYNFKVIPIEILGTIYEQFLGKVVVTTDKRASIDYKPEVRKAGGVYYTPDYIVNYIVEKTVGEKLKECKNFEDVLEIKICDPACGSGSFLLSAYETLIQWTIEYYKSKIVVNESGNQGVNPSVELKGLSKEERKLVYLDSDGQIRLTSKIKRELLKSCIYGVDIDAQAVEVTKMSLSLKALENTNHYEVHNERTLFHTTILPTLEGNIKCGNSLVGTDFYQDKDIALFSMESMKKLNAFEWNQEFPVIEKRKGFDIVIGNPPYVRQEILGEDFKKYAQSKFVSYAGTADLYVYFIEKSLNLIHPEGVYSVIVANKWMRANYGEALRKYLKQKQIQEIIDFGDLPVFTGATTYPCIVRIQNDAPQDFLTTQVKSLEFSSLQEEVQRNHYIVNYKSLDDKGWSLSNQKESALLDKIKKAGIPLGEYVEGKIYRGVLTGLNEAFVIDEVTKDRLIKEDPKSAEIIKPFLAGRDVKRYKEPIVDKYLIFTRRGIDIKKYPAILNHLEQYKEQLKPKPKDWPKSKEWKGRKPGPYQWYEIQDSIDYYKEFEKEKIIYAEISIKGAFTYDEKNNFSDTTSYIIPINSKYLLGILNSNLFSFLFKKSSSEIRGGFLRWKRQYMAEIPIPKLDLSIPKQKEVHDKIVSLVDTMLSLHATEGLTPQLTTTAITDGTKKAIQQKIELVDKQIDKLVYELYGLTEDEIEIVEEKKSEL